MSFLTCYWYLPLWTSSQNNKFTSENKSFLLCSLEIEIFVIEMSDPIGSIFDVQRLVFKKQFFCLLDLSFSLVNPWLIRCVMRSIKQSSWWLWSFSMNSHCFIALKECWISSLILLSTKWSLFFLFRFLQNFLWTEKT